MHLLLLLQSWAQFAATAWGARGFMASSQRGPAAKPLVGGQGTKPPEAESLFRYQMSKIRRKITSSQCFEIKLNVILTTSYRPVRLYALYRPTQTSLQILCYSY